MPEDQISQEDIELAKNGEVKIDDELGDDELPQQIRYSINSYGADYPVDGLVKRLENKDIIIPEFQRQFVWRLPQASRFIESLLLGLPVPGIFLSKEENTRKLLVIDGQQRLLTLQYFYAGVFADTSREFALRGVQDEFKNITFRKLRDEDRRTLDNSIIHATVIQQDEPLEDDSSIYHIFERLNTGGTLLTPQEIRACIYHGPFNSLLRKLNTNQDWRSIFGPASPRMRDCELILRFFALYFMQAEYSRPMNEFLNRYMNHNRNIKNGNEQSLLQLFSDNIAIIHKALGKLAFRPKRSLNAAVFDAVMVGIARRQQKGPISDYKALSKAYEKLVSNKDFSDATEQGTAKEDSVQKRIQLAVESFRTIV